jgi:hypothetical protein
LVQTMRVARRFEAQPAKNLKNGAANAVSRAFFLIVRASAAHRCIRGIAQR